MDSNQVIPFSESTFSRLFGEGCVWPCARSVTFAASSAMTKYMNEKTFMGLQYVSDFSLRGEFPTLCLWERWGAAQYRSEFGFGNGRHSTQQNGRHVPTFRQTPIPQGDRRSINSKGSARCD